MSAASGTPLVLVVEHETRCGLGRLDPLPGCVARSVSPYLGEPLPDDLAGIEGLMVLGGSMAAWDDEGAPWLPQVRSLLRQAVQEDVPTLGVCLGAQLLALAAGGQVGPGQNGPELGLLPVQRNEAGRADPLLGALDEEFLVPHAHYDEVQVLPEGGQVLASSALYRHQAFRLGSNAWGVQYHPEVTTADFAVWMAQDAPALADQGRTAEQVVAQVRSAQALVDATARAHAAAFAALVRRAAGRP